MSSLSPDLLSRVEPLSRTALANLHLPALLAELMPRVRDLFDADTVAMLLLTDDARALVREAALGMDDDAEEVPVGAGFAGRIAAERTPLVLDSVADGDLMGRSLVRSGVKSLLGSPILLDRRLLGVIHVGTREPRQFTAVDIELLELVAAHVALAVDRARLYEAEHAARVQAEAAAERFSAIDRHRQIGHTLAATVAETADCNPALTGILRTAGSELGWDLAQMWTIDPNVDVLRWKDVWVADEALQEFVAASQATRFVRGTGLPGRVWESGQPEWVSDVLLDPHSPRLAAAAHTALRTGAAFPIRSSGRTFGFVEFFCRTVRAPDAELMHTIEAIMAQMGQVLHRGLVEAERDRLLADAADASRARDELLATLAHELRTPVNAMIGWLQMVRSGELDEGRCHHALDTIERNARIQAQLVEDLVDLTRMSRATLRLDIRPCMPAECVESALDSLEPAAAAKDITVRRQIDRSAGPVHADPDRLQQIVWNLMSNAVKYTPRGGMVRVRLERGEADVRLMVSDTGQGIDAAFLPHAFEPFRQSETSERRAAGGLGLGLAIVKRLVTMHGGTVDAASDGEGRGATFTVTLPLAG